jgi:Ran GTPase-activating protein (RanGAP) involved in mRNA processing and transport
MNYCKLGHSHADHVLQSFKHMKNLKEVHMRGHNLVTANKLLGFAFMECKNLEILDISDNNVKLINQRCHDSLQDLIVNTRKLRILIMDDYSLNDEEATNYIDSLHMNPTLVKFNF